MAEVFKSPSSMSKKKTKELVHKLKNGSPKFQEVLRERCRERMREKRGALFNKRRVLLNDFEKLHDNFSDVIRKELSSLTNKQKQEIFGEEIIDIPLNFDEALELENEILEEEEKWMFSEYQKMLDNEELMYDSMIETEYRENIFCPMCQRTILSQDENNIKCSICDFWFPNKCCLADLKRCLDSAINRHSSYCINAPNFTTVQEKELNLYLTCSACYEIMFIL